MLRAMRSCRRAPPSCRARSIAAPAPISSGQAGQAHTSNGRRGLGTSRRRRWDTIPTDWAAVSGGTPFSGATSGIIKSPMLVAIDVSNHQTVFGLYAGERLTHHWRISTNLERTTDEHGA